jgi:hypothetical protein
MQQPRSVMRCTSHAYVCSDRFRGIIADQRRSPRPVASLNRRLSHDDSAESRRARPGQADQPWHRQGGGMTSGEAASAQSGTAKVPVAVTSTCRTATANEDVIARDGSTTYATATTPDSMIRSSTVSKVSP